MARRSGRWLSQAQAELVGAQHDRTPVGQTELGEHRGDVVVRHLGRDEEPATKLLIQV
jgi:hypothetical protein